MGLNSNGPSNPIMKVVGEQQLSIDAGQSSTEAREAQFLLDLLPSVTLHLSLIKWNFHTKEKGR